MPYNPEIHHRRSIRLKEYDYSSAGAYFVTLCAWQRECVFGAIVDTKMVLKDVGEIVLECWSKITEHFVGVDLDISCIMPNHFHGIIILNVGAGFPRPDMLCNVTENKGGETPPLRSATLGNIMGYFKYQSTKRINQHRNNPGCPVWQRNYYERVIRNDGELTCAREYIVNNPMKWELDKENPANNK